MDGQAPPPLDAVVPEPLAVEVEDALPSGMDGQAPPLDGVARDPLTVSDELQPTGEVVAEEDALPVAPGIVKEDALPVAPGIVKGEVEVEEDVLPVAADIVKGEVVEEEDVLPVATDIVNDASSEGPEAGSGGVVLTDELRERIVKQVEYYFSDENLPTDEFLLKFVKKNKKGFVPIEIIASFRKMKKLVQDLSVIEAALRTSPKLVVSSDGKRVRRLHPLPHSELKDSKKSTVLVENLPPDFSRESIQEKFGTVGKVVSITINDPELVNESSNAKKPDFNLSSKVHVLVEYEAVEAAEKAVTVLSDERNWRTGMKVRLLSKQSVMGLGKYNKPSKENQDAVSKKIDQNHHSKEDHRITSEKISNADAVGGTKDKENVKSVLTTETEHHDLKPNSRGRKGRYKAQGQVQQNTNKQGSSGSESLNKPIPGPRMPDGTRGFTLGRGRSLPLQKSEKAEE